MTDIERDGYQVDPIRFAVRKKQTLIENPITELETGRVSTPTSANMHNKWIREVRVREEGFWSCQLPGSIGIP